MHFFFLFFFGNQCAPNLMHCDKLGAVLAYTTLYLVTICETKNWRRKVECISFSSEKSKMSLWFFFPAYHSKAISLLILIYYCDGSFRIDFKLQQVWRNILISRKRIGITNIGSRSSPYIFDFFSNHTLKINNAALQQQNLERDEMIPTAKSVSDSWT